MLIRARYVKSSKRENVYGHLPHKNISELKLWDSVHVDLMGPYRNYIRKQQPGDTIISNNDSMTCIMMINPAIGWFEIVDISTYNLNEVTSGNDEYIDKSSSRVIQVFNNTWLCR